MNVERFSSLECNFDVCEQVSANATITGARGVAEEPARPRLLSPSFWQAADQSWSGLHCQCHHHRRPLPLSLSPLSLRSLFSFWLSPMRLRSISANWNLTLSRSSGVLHLIHLATLWHYRPRAAAAETLPCGGRVAGGDTALRRPCRRLAEGCVQLFQIVPSCLKLPRIVLVSAVQAGRRPGWAD